MDYLAAVSAATDRPTSSRRRNSWRPPAVSPDMVHLLTLPFRIVFGLLFGILLLPFALLAFPFLLLRFVVKAAAGADHVAVRRSSAPRLASSSPRSPSLLRDRCVPLIAVGAGGPAVRGPSRR